MAKSAKKSKGKSGGTMVAGGKGSGGKGVKGTKGVGGKGNGGRSSGTVAAEAGSGAGVAAAADVEDSSAATAFTVALRAGQGFTLSALDPRSTPGFSGGKAAAAALTASTDAELDDLQERLYAESRTGGTRAILLVVQGMDTAGKGGIMRHVVGSVDPQGVRYTAFKAPTAQEKRPSLPVAHPQRAADARADRGVRPLPLRGRADRPRARPGAPGDLGPPLRRDQHVRVRPWWRRARPSSR